MFKKKSYVWHVSVLKHSNNKIIGYADGTAKTEHKLMSRNELKDVRKFFEDSFNCKIVILGLTRMK